MTFILYGVKCHSIMKDIAQFLTSRI